PRTVAMPTSRCRGPKASRTRSPALCLAMKWRSRPAWKPASASSSPRMAIPYAGLSNIYRTSVTMTSSGSRSRPESRSSTTSPRISRLNAAIIWKNPKPDDELSRGLPAVHRLVGPLHHRFRRVERVDHPDADRDAQWHGVAVVGEFAGADLVDQPGRGLVRVIPVRGLEQDADLVAGDPGHRVGVP